MSRWTLPLPDASAGRRIATWGCRNRASAPFPCFRPVLYREPHNPNVLGSQDHSRRTLESRGARPSNPPTARTRDQPIREERHGQGSDAQQQGKEEAEGRMEQEEERRPRPLALRFGAGATPARAEPVRQEKLAGRFSTPSTTP